MSHHHGKNSLRWEQPAHEFLDFMLKYAVRKKPKNTEKLKSTQCKIVYSYRLDVYVIICLMKSLVSNKQAAQPSDNYLCHFPANYPIDSHFRDVFYKVVQKPLQD